MSSRSQHYKSMSTIYKEMYQPPQIFAVPLSKVDVSPPSNEIKEAFISVQETASDASKFENLTQEELVNMYPKVNSNFILQSDLIDIDFKNGSSPEVFGPPLWFTMHNASTQYPVKPSPMVVESMKGFILSIPLLVPCEKCSVHACTFIESKYDTLTRVCSSQESLFEFFVDFHNYVNERLSKPAMSYDTAKILYM